MKNALALALALTIALANLAALAAADPAINESNQAYWRSALQKYRDDDNVGQVLLVRCTGGCGAIVKFYRKLTDENNAWELVFETDGIIGKNGYPKTGEGDAKTPFGDFGVLSAFGIRKNPGTALKYIDVKPTTYACDENCMFYNRIIDTAETGHDCKGEQMYKLSPEYNYGLELDYNPNRVWPTGSAKFIQCKGEKLFTGGCVAIDEALMREVLECAGPGMRVIIGEN